MDAMQDVERAAGDGPVHRGSGRSDERLHMNDRAWTTAKDPGHAADDYRIPLSGSSPQRVRPDPVYLRRERGAVAVRKQTNTTQSSASALIRMVSPATCAHCIYRALYAYAAQTAPSSR